MYRFVLTLLWFVAAGIFCFPSCTLAYFNNANWSFTATDGPVPGDGTPITLTWGISDDGTTVPNVLPGVNRSSDLIDSLDTWYGDGGGGLLSSRPWFSYLESGFQAWDDVSGLTFIYESNDDGLIHGFSPGVTGVRGDIRLAGGRYDGTVGSNTGTLAYSIAPNNADIFFDTDDVAYYSDATDNAFQLRHTLMHEIGHSLGLGHVTSNSAKILLEPFQQSTFDGPQVDDIRGVQWMFGDPLESGGGNNTLATATPLGSLSVDETATVGADGSVSEVTLGMNDFISVHRSSDIDYYSFNVTESVRVGISLIPVGVNYDQQIGGGASTTIMPSRVGNLALEVSDVFGLIDSSNSGGFGDSEGISFVATPGFDFSIKVSGVVGATQLYRLDVSTFPLGIEGDYNGDGFVDAADFTVWRDSLQGGGGLAADGNADGLVGIQDYQVWTASYGYASPAAVSVPEPASGIALFFLAILRITVDTRCRV